VQNGKRVSAKLQFEAVRKNGPAPAARAEQGGYAVRGSKRWITAADGKILCLNNSKTTDICGKQHD